MCSRGRAEVVAGRYRLLKAAWGHVLPNEAHPRQGSFDFSSRRDTVGWTIAWTATEMTTPGRCREASCRRQTGGCRTPRQESPRLRVKPTTAGALARLESG